MMSLRAMLLWQTVQDNPFVVTALGVCSARCIIVQWTELMSGRAGWVVVMFFMLRKLATKQAAPCNSILVHIALRQHLASTLPA